MINDTDYETQMREFMEGYIDGMKQREDFYEMKKKEKQEEVIEATQFFREHLCMLNGIKMMHDFNKTQSIFLNKLLGVK